jgi:hypothetical protein
MIEPSHVEKFAAVYAEAVLTFLDTGEPQWVTWDGYSHRFDFTSVVMDDPLVPAMTLIDANWTQIAGDVNEIVDPESPDFDIDALRNAIEAFMIDEGYGEQLLKGFQERLERFQAGDYDEEDEDEPPMRELKDDDF